MKKKKAVALLMAVVMSVTTVPVESFAMETDSQLVSEEMFLSGAEEIQSEELILEETEDMFTDEGNLSSEENTEEMPPLENVEDTPLEDTEIFVDDIPETETEQEQEEIFVDDQEETAESAGNFQEELLTPTPEPQEDFADGADSALEASAQEFTYTIKNNKICITKWNGTAADLLIPDSIEEKPVTEIASGAFENAATLETVTLPAQSIRLRNNAFKNCTALRQVTIQKNLDDIGDEPFFGCTSLKTIVLSRDISEMTWRRTKKSFGPALEEFVVDPENPYLESIQGVLYTKDNTDKNTVKALCLYPINRPGEAYEVESETKELLRYAFAGSINLKKLTIASSVADWNYSVTEMPILEEVVIEGGEDSRYSTLLEDCPNLKILDIRTPFNLDLGDLPLLEEIRIGNAVTTDYILNKNWFRNTKSYIVEEGNTVYQVLDEALCDHEGKLLAFPKGSTRTEYQIPDEVKAIGWMSFSGNSNLLSVSMNNQVEVIESNAFMECTQLSSMGLSEGLKKIEAKAFSYCESLTSMEVKSKAENFEWEEEVWYGCKNLKQLSIDVSGKMPLGILGNTDLDMLILGARVTSVVSDGYNSSQIKEIQIDGENPFILEENQMVITSDRKNVFAYANGSETDTLTVPEGVEILSERCFYKAENLSEVILPSSLKEIGSRAFSRCTNLSKAVIPEGTENIRAYAFYDCENLAYADIPSSVQQIEEDAFDCIIWGHKDTEAERYAKENNLMFVDKDAIEEDTEVPGNLPESKWDGSKTEEIVPKGKTYVIENAEQLAWMAQQTAEGNNFLGCTFKLIADIDLNGRPWTPIGNNENPFYGCFDGQGHRIRNLSINNELPSHNGFGLFGSVKARASGKDIYIRDLTIENVQMDYGDDQGALAGVINCGLGVNLTIENCHVSGNIKGGTLGGLAGVVYCGATGSEVVVRNCTSQAQIVTSGDGGGIIGRLETFSGQNTGKVLVQECQFSGTTGATGRYGKPSGIVSRIACDTTAKEIRIERCVNKAKINGSSYANQGGIISSAGKNVPVIIEKCVNKGNVYGGYGIGGIAGYIGGNVTISQCFNAGKIGYGYTGSEMGGICGISDGTIRDCYNDGRILNTSAMDYNGGITGANGGIIENCYNVGVIPGSGNTSVAVAYPGAISCINGNVIRHCYYNLDDRPEQWLIAKVYCQDQPREVYTSEDGKRVESGGLTTAQMKISESYREWDFENIWEFDSNYGYGYPILTGIKDLIDPHPDNSTEQNTRNEKEMKFAIVGKVREGEKKAPVLEGVTIRLGNETAVTNEKGFAVIKTDQSAADLEISKQDYVTYRRSNFKIPKNKEVHHVLYRTDEVTPFDLGSVLMTYNQNDYELLSEEKQINRFFKDTEFTIKASPTIESDQISSYVLVQVTDKNCNKIAESKNGEFRLKSGQFQPTKQDKNHPRSEIEIQTLDQSGAVRKSTRINLEVVQEEEKETSFTFGRGLKFTVDDSIPLFGGMEMSLSSFKLPVYFVMEPKDDMTTVCRLGVNLLESDLRDIEKTKIFSACTNMDFLDPDALMEKRNKFLDQMKKSSKKKTVNFMPGLDMSFEIYGYAECEIPASNVLKGKLFVEIEVEGSVEGQAGPVVLAGDITGTVGSHGEFTLDTVELKNWEGTVGIHGDAGLTAFVGLGVAYLASVGVYGSGEFGLDATALPYSRSGFNSIWLNGNLGVMGRLLGHSVKYPLLKGKHYLYNRDTDYGRSSEKAANVGEVLSDYDEYEIAAENSYDADAKWQGDAQNFARASSQEKTLLKNTYPETAPVMFTSGSDTVMVFVNNCQDRDAADTAALYYSVYTGGTGWSAPKLVADNGTADYNPQVASDGTNSWVVWNDASSSLKGVASIEGIASKMEVSTAKYDSSTHSFQTQTTLTSNNQYEIMPQISVVSGQPIVSWTLNSNGDLWRLSGTNSVYAAWQASGKWTSKKVVEISGILAGEAIGTLNDIPYYAYVADEDGNIQNAEGRKGYLINIQTGSRIPLEGQQVTNVRFGKVGGTNQLLWTDAKGKLYSRSGEEAAIIHSFGQEGMIGTVRQVVQGENGKAAILLTRNSDRASDAYITYYDPELKKWSELSRIIDSSAYVEQIQGAFIGDKLVLTFNERQLNIDNDKDNGTNNLMCKTITQESVELTLDDILFWQKDVRAGSDLPLTLTVKNQGNKACTREMLLVKQNGTTILEKELKEEILSGQTKSISVNLTLPQEMSKSEYEVKIQGLNADGKVLTETSKNITLGNADFRAESRIYRNGDLYTVGLTVYNDGYAAGSCKAIYYNADDPSEVYGEQSVPNLEPEEIWNTSMDFAPEDVGNRAFAKIGIRIESEQETEDGRYNNETSAALFWNQEVRQEKILLSETLLNLEKGQEHKLTAVVMPENSSQTVVWSSSNESVVRVSAEGMVYAADNGKAYVTAATEDGTLQASCRVIVETVHEHVWDKGKVTKEPDCQNPGTKTYTCADCGETKTEEIPADKNRHSFVTIIDKKATCGKEGRQHRECKVCGYKEEGTEIKATGKHSYGGYSVTKKATVFATGRKTRQCRVCKTTQSVTLSKLKPTLRLNVSSITMQVKQKTSGVKVSGLAAGDYVKSWKSSNTRVVKVDRKGKLTAQSRTGKVTVTVTLASGKKGSFRVTVQKNKVATSRLTGIPKRLTLQKGKSYTLKPVRSPFTAQDKITYSSSNKKVATVSSKGKIAAKKAGSTNITVRSGKKKAVVKITVPKTQTKTLSKVPASLTMKRGKTYQLRVKRSPSNSDYSITYKSSNKKIATVDKKGKIKALKKGTVNITVQSGKIKKTFRLTVK